MQMPQPPPPTVPSVPLLRSKAVCTFTQRIRAFGSLNVHGRALVAFKRHSVSTTAALWSLLQRHRHRRSADNVWMCCCTYYVRYVVLCRCCRISTRLASCDPCVFHWACRSVGPFVNLRRRSCSCWRYKHPLRARNRHQHGGVSWLSTFHAQHMMLVVRWTLFARGPDHMYCTGKNTLPHLYR